MIWVDVEKETTSASNPGNRADIDRLKERKRTKDDFDAILVQEGSRWTRSGASHGSWLRTEFEMIGVKIVRMSSKMGNSRLSWLEEGLEDETAFEYVSRLAYASARGLEAKIKDGLIPHCKAPPFGIDRRYETAEGKPICIIRNMRDGTQQRLHPVTKELLETYPAEVKNTPSRHFRKQKTDRVVLVPGAEDRLEMVRFVMHHHFVVGHGFKRISVMMAKKGWRAPNDGEWNAQSVGEVVRRTAYSGHGIHKLWAVGKFVIQDREAPKEIDYNLGAMMRVKRKKPTMRPPEDWRIIEYPELFTILDPELREHVWQQQLKYVTAQATGTAIPQKRDKHALSKFFLKQHLTCKVSGKRFCGKTAGRGHRYYYLATFYQMPCLDYPWMRHGVPADVVENKAKELLKEALASPADLRQIVTDVVKNEYQKNAKSDVDIDVLERERAQVDQQLNFALKELSDLGEEGLRKVIGPLKDRRRVLEAGIFDIKSEKGKKRPEAAVTVEAVLDGLQDISRSIDGMEPQVLRNFFGSFTEMKMDLKTMEFDVDVKLPAWAVDRASDLKSKYRLVSGLESKTLPETKNEKPTILASYGCLLSHKLHGRHRKPCVTCTRKAA